LKSLLVAVAFLTIVPIRFRDLPAPAVVARSRVWFPAVGVLLGLVLGGATALAVRFGSPMIGAFLVLLVWVGVTGALHVDGFSDLCDGLFGGRTPEDRLRIMKDPHVGSFGLAGGVFVLLGKFVALHELMRRAPLLAPLAVGGAVAVARCLAPVLAAGARYPRPDGTGKAFVEATRGSEGKVFALFAVSASLTPFLGEPILGLALFGASFVTVLALRAICERRLGGITGDCVGAGIEGAELAYLFAALALAP
jgi:adenosylcobinamide-GDP ribazoletransferase